MASKIKVACVILLVDSNAPIAFPYVAIPFGVEAKPVGLLIKRRSEPANYRVGIRLSGAEVDAAHMLGSTFYGGVLDAKKLATFSRRNLSCPTCTRFSSLMLERRSSSLSQPS